VLLGITGKEGSVIEFVLTGFLTTSRPPISAVFPSLSSVISSDKANARLGAYIISPKMSEKDAAKELINLLEDFFLLTSLRSREQV
jgi:hypothetical protein